MFFAHSALNQPKSKWHYLRDHLVGSATRAKEVGSEFGAGRAAHLAALLHDLGKYTPAFQARLSGAEIQVDHSTAGAFEVLKLSNNESDKHFAKLIAFGIAGHHAGLPDWVSNDSSSQQSSLSNRLQRHDQTLTDPVWRAEIHPDGTNLRPGEFTWDNMKTKFAFQSAFLGRMLFSCLVEGDHRDTEAFFDEVRGQTSPREWVALEDILPNLQSQYDQHLRLLSASNQPSKKSSLHELRQSILSSVLSKVSMQKGFFTLTVPTGGGKTLASLGFALKHANEHGLRRIIYVAPYTSIIDQTARVFSEVLGSDVVLEHHSALDFETMKLESKFRDSDRHQQNDEAKLRLAMDDWAAPVVVTTSVQFFESLFACRPSKCRKLHAIANSIIILDEAQTLPRQFLLPTLAALRELVTNYGVSIVLCTATQPALNLKDFPEGLPLEGRELAPDPSELADQLKRTTLRRAGKMTDDQLVEALASKDQGLIIVNTRRHALELFRAAKAANLSGLVHLTTRQYPAHRQRILDEVRHRLKANSPCRVIATSLVEAGVDVDFPAVWRAEAGLDQIAQAAGRCNREGKRSAETSFITVFTPASSRTPKEMKQLAQAFEIIADEFPNREFSPEAIRAYFNDILWQQFDDLDRHKILERFALNGSELDYSYRSVAELYRLIDDIQVPIFIPIDDRAKAAIADLEDPSKRPGPALRVLQRYTVQVYQRDRDLLLQARKIEVVQPDRLGDRFWRIVDAETYKDDEGLVWDAADNLEASGSIF